MEDAENIGFVYEFGPFVVDPKERTIFVNGVAKRLPAKEFDTLLLLIENNGHALTKDQMISEIWPDAFVEESNLAKQISRLRKLLNSGSEQYIETLPKHGYRFSAELRQVEQRDDDAIVIEKRTVKRVSLELGDDEQNPPKLLNAKKRSFAKPLFTATNFPGWSIGGWGRYAVSADGQRFLIDVPAKDTFSPITVVLNWAAEFINKN